MNKFRWVVFLLGITGVLLYAAYRDQQDLTIFQQHDDEQTAANKRLQDQLKTNQEPPH